MHKSLLFFLFAGVVALAACPQSSFAQGYGISGEAQGTAILNPLLYDGGEYNPTCTVAGPYISDLQQTSYTFVPLACGGTYEGADPESKALYTESSFVSLPLVSMTKGGAASISVSERGGTLDSSLTDGAHVVAQMVWTDTISIKVNGPPAGTPVTLRFTYNVAGSSAQQNIAGGQGFSDNVSLTGGYGNSCGNVYISDSFDPNAPFIDSQRSFLFCGTSGTKLALQKYLTFLDQGPKSGSSWSASGHLTDSVSIDALSPNVTISTASGVNYSSGFSQGTSTAQWAWMTGSDTVNNAGVYGQLGVPAPGNTPGARDQSVSWTDANGDLWLFGGYWVSFSGLPYYYQALWNDLWRYTPSSGEWAWMGGSTQGGASGVYGTLGVPAAANIPGGRFGSVSWTDKNGNLWLFGGTSVDGYHSAGMLNDLWQYAPSTGQWTWMTGSATPQPGVYGQLGVPAVGNTPGGRQNAVSWADADGNLWLYGGSGLNSPEFFNDLWRYTPSNGLWTWMAGSDTPNASGVYGTLDVPAAGNTPGSRAAAVSWTDIRGNLWLFGGSGYGSAASGTSGSLNDLWRYTPSTGDWTWMAGSAVSNQPGIYGQVGAPAAVNTPGSRYGAMSWTDASGNLWLLGGYGDDIVNHSSDLNDVWRYSPSTGQWAWMAGSNTTQQPGVYGQQGVPSTANAPGARHQGVSWADPAGNAWVFGGLTSSLLNDGNGYFSVSTGDLNDLWRLPISTATVARPQAQLNPSILTFSPTTINTTAGYQQVRLTNTGSATLNISSIAVTNTASPYSWGIRDQTCATTLAVGQSCTFSIAFRPTSTGTLTADITIADNAGGSPQKIAMTGAGLPVNLPVAQLNPASLTFPPTTAGKTAGYQQVTLTNTGAAILNISSIAVTNTTSPYSWGIRQQTCGSTLATGSSCTFSVAFRPTSTGSLTADITIADNAAGSTQKIALSGTGK